MTEEPEDVKQLRKKLKAIEEQRKRDIAKLILAKHLLKRKGMWICYTQTGAIDAMIEFHETMKKTGI